MEWLVSPTYKHEEMMLKIDRKTYQVEFPMAVGHELSSLLRVYVDVLLLNTNSIPAIFGFSSEVAYELKVTLGFR